MSPLVTLDVHRALVAAVNKGEGTVECSLDLQRSTTRIDVDPDGWSWEGQRYPHLERCKDRTIYHWTGEAFEPVARFGDALIKLVPTPWGAPTFEIDGIKMLPTAKVSPYEDARSKVALIQPGGKNILDTCGGLGYFAAWCLAGEAAQILSYEKNADVMWLRALNPWSPPAGGVLRLTQGDITQQIGQIPTASVDAVLHDPPRFGIAGELYSQAFYDQLARVLRGKGKLFHYTGAPNKQSRGRDLPAEVIARLRSAGFTAQPSGDGVLAVKTGGQRRR